MHKFGFKHILYNWVDLDKNLSNSILPKLISTTEVMLVFSQFREQIFLFSFEPKSERNHFLIFALASL